ncbi:MAG TPA: hypothetical protein PLQ35_01890 [bacterium]|nr:hypothetical protein [bacterium]HQL61022.1 hypothetical protein [bacterium]
MMYRTPLSSPYRCNSSRLFKIAAIFVISLVVSQCSAYCKAPGIILENRHVRWEIGTDGRNVSVIDLRTGEDYLDRAKTPEFAFVVIKDRVQPITNLEKNGDILYLAFGETGVTAQVTPTIQENFFLFRVTDVKGTDVERFTLFNLSLVENKRREDRFTGCSLALNLQTDVPEIPMDNTQLRAICCPKFGMEGAEAALILCPYPELRSIMKEVVLQAKEIPRSDIGGPWALDAPINRGSYLFNFGDLSEDTVDEWIALARQLGINQIDFHGGSSFRFGDCFPNPKTYPKGKESLKAVIDRLHEAGIAAGLHTYAFFIDKNCPWVTPVPDPRLAKDIYFTLADDLTDTATDVPVIETTEQMSTITGFFIHNSVTLQIDDELINYANIRKSPPYAFTECTRGAYGTCIAPHKAGARIGHLKECFGLFVPDAESTLLAEVAAKSAETFNDCGFDMIYLDALDGESILGGPEYAWHYGSRFVFELCKRLKKSPLMEMSTFHHHLWYVRARMGAWDHPTRGHKRFIDIHCKANEEVKRMFLPPHLGWWAIKTWTGVQGEPTFSDDIEYLCAKCIGHDIGFSIMGINPQNRDKPVYQRLANIMRQYEDLRHANYFSESVKEQLRVPGNEFTLVEESQDRWRFDRMEYHKHKVTGVDNDDTHWQIENKYQKQPLRIRIEALMSAGPLDATDAVMLIDFASGEPLPERKTAAGVEFNITSGGGVKKDNRTCSLLSVKNTGQPNAKAAWAMAGKTFDPLLDLRGKDALGVWIYGDGKGEVLNVQLRNAEHLTNRGMGEHYVIVDFTGWRYFELVELESERYANYTWPYGSDYSIYRENVELEFTKWVTVYCNDVPQGAEIQCGVGPVKALPLVPITLKDLSITVGGMTITFPVRLETGQYLECYSLADCKLYGRDGELLGEVNPEGDLPDLQPGKNEIEFDCKCLSDASARARITVMTKGEAIK